MEMTFLLNKEELEVAFISCYTEVGQLNRLQRMAARGMIGFLPAPVSSTSGQIISTR